MRMRTYTRPFWFLAALFLSVVSANADPIELPEKPVTPEITFLIVCAILLEVVCIWLVLWCSQKPRFFVLWLIGMHLLTYPAFLGVLWLSQYASGFCRWRGRGSGSIGRRNLDLSDLPFYPTGQIKPDYTIGYQMFVRFTAWKYVFGGRIPGFNNDL